MSAKFQGRQEKDLFEQFQGTEKKVRTKTRFLIPRIKDSITVSYENIIFLSISLLIVCIICFSLGVEKGRRESGLLTPAGNIAVLDISRDNEKVSREPLVSVETPARTEGKHVLQLAAFRGLGPAERERDDLRRDGYNADIRKSGEYYQLYVGGLATKTEAERLKEKLRNRYNDCYVYDKEL